MTATGYTRQSSAQISSGLGITSASVNNEFNQLQAAFSNTSGHDHSGGSGLGSPLTGASLSGVGGSATGLMSVSAGVFGTVTLTGTSNQITVVNGTGAAGNPTISIDTGYIGQTSITTLGTIATGVWNGTAITGTYGGTGVNNGANTITLGGNVNTASTFTTTGSFSLTLATTGATSVTLPTSGTLVNTSVTTLSSLTSVGTISTGVWQGTALGVTYGGTGTSLSATGGTSNVLLQASTGANITVRQLAASDLSNGNTGTGANVLANTPTLITPVLGAATATSINGLTLTSSTGTLSIANAKTLTASNSLTLAGTDGTTITFQGTDTYVGRATTDTFTNKTFDTAGTGNTFKINGTGISAITGTGSVVLAASPTLTGTPLAPTATGGTNTTQVATTAFVTSAISAIPASAAPIQGTFKHLKHVWASNTTTTITADQVILMNGSNTPYLATSVSLTLNSATSGANGIDTGSVTTNTWYYVYVIYNGTTVSSLMSTSSTAPSMPGAYTYLARIGTVRTDGSSNFIGFIQYGRRVQYVVGNNLTSMRNIDGNTSAQGSTSTPTFITEAVGAFVPSTASQIRVVVTSNGSGGVNAIVVPNNSYGAISSTTNPPFIGFGPSTGVQSSGDIVLETTNIYWAQSGNGYLWCAGYEDNI